MPIRLTLMDQMAHVAREQGKTLVPLNDDLTTGPQWTSPPAELTDILASEIAAWERQRNDLGVRSNGCSQPRKPAPKWAAPTPSPPTPKRPRSKSHNHCAAVLA